MRKIQCQEVGHDEAADGRACDRAEQGGDRDPGQRLDVGGFRHGAQKHDAAHGHHHGPGHALQHARADKFGQRVGKGAEYGACREKGNGGAEDIARAEAVRHPAAHRDENGDGQHVGGDGEVEAHRIFAEAFRHFGQGGGNDRRIQHLHEKGRTHDHGDEDGGAGLFLSCHGRGSASSLRASSASAIFRRWAGERVSSRWASQPVRCLFRASIRMHPSSVR